MKTITCDVLIVGGGCAGVCAAISAARKGVKTVLIEKTSYLGGLLTHCGVSPLSTAYADDKKVIGGLVDEIFDNVKANGFNVINVGGGIYPLSVFCQKDGLKYTFEKMCTDSGVTVLYNTTLVESTVKNGRIETCRALTGDGYLNICAKTYIDASGDAVLASASSVKCVYGDGNGNTQSMAMLFYVSNVDDDKVETYVNENRETRCCKTADRWILCDFKEKVAEAHENGELSFYTRRNVNAFETTQKGEYVINMTIVNSRNILDPAKYEKAEAEGKKQVREVIGFLKKYIPGFENCILEYIGDLGVRETNKVAGSYCINENELVNNVMFSDAIAMGAYPIDLHNARSGQIERVKLKKNSWYSIPYRALTTEEVSNLLVTGRCISSTQLANSAIRVSLTLMAVSQSAGTAAALSALDHADVNKLDVSILRETLKSDGVFLDEYREKQE